MPSSMIQFFLSKRISGVQMLKAARKRLHEGHKRMIVMIGSVASQVNFIGFSVYGASKFAIRGFCEGLYMEGNVLNTHVMCVFPPNTG